MDESRAAPRIGRRGLFGGLGVAAVVLGALILALARLDPPLEPTPRAAGNTPPAMMAPGGAAATPVTAGAAAASPAAGSPVAPTP